MPQKTKAAKIAAAQRRFSYVKQEAGGGFVYEKVSKEKASRSEAREGNTIADKLYLKRDLVKILVTCFLIIAFQVLLSLTLF